MLPLLGHDHLQQECHNQTASPLPGRQRNGKILHAISAPPSTQEPVERSNRYASGCGVAAAGKTAFHGMICLTLPTS
jgi:hypothetical protein